MSTDKPRPFLQSHADWSRALSLLTTEQLKAVRQLAVVQGLLNYRTALPSGVLLYFAAYVEERDSDGAAFLTSPMHRSILQVCSLTSTCPWLFAASAAEAAVRC